MSVRRGGGAVGLFEDEEEDKEKEEDGEDGEEDGGSGASFDEFAERSFLPGCVCFQSEPHLIV